MKKINSVVQTQPSGPYTLRDGLIFFKNKVVVPQALRDTLLFEAHDTKIGGHFGILRTFKR